MFLKLAKKMNKQENNILSLPKLIGSDEQKKWAEKIRSKKLKNMPRILHCLIKKMQEVKYRKWQKNI